MTRRDLALRTVVNDTISGEAEDVEPVRHRGPRRLRRVAVTPVLRREAPADLDARHEPGRRRGPVNPMHAPSRSTHHEAVPVLGPVGQHAVDVGVGLGPGLQRPEELHHERIGVDRRVGRAIGVRPTAQQQALGADLGDHDADVVERGPHGGLRHVGDDLDAVGAVEHERQPAGQRLLVAAHQRHEVVVAEPRRGRPSAGRTCSPTTARCSSTRSASMRPRRWASSAA